MNNKKKIFQWINNFLPKNLMFLFWSSSWPTGEGVHLFGTFNKDISAKDGIRDESYLRLTYQKPFGLDIDENEQSIALSPFYPAEANSFLHENVVVLNIDDKVTGRLGY
jgi:hypothetical protein